MPERREELTTEGGLDVARGPRRDRARIAQRSSDAGIAVWLFIDPDLDQIEAAHRVGARRGRDPHRPLLRARLARGPRDRELARIVDAAKAAAKLGLEVAAGHGLNYHNVPPVAAIREIEEFNIGHAIVARAVLVGMERAVREMKALIADASPVRPAPRKP